MTKKVQNSKKIHEIQKVQMIQMVQTQLLQKIQMVQTAPKGKVEKRIRWKKVYGFCGKTTTVCDLSGKRYTTTLEINYGL